MPSGRLITPRNRRTTRESFAPKLALRLSLACFLLVPLLGCVSNRKHAAASKVEATGSIDEINLLAIPVALNLDGIPGADGFALKLYAGNRRRPKPMPIVSGKIEIRMYDGFPKGTPGETPALRRVWVYTAEQLKNYEIQTSIGVGYQLAPRWEEARPASDKITVVVRYTPASGPAISSAPSVIAANVH